MHVVSGVDIGLVDPVARNETVDIDDVFGFGAADPQMVLGKLGSRPQPYLAKDQRQSQEAAPHLVSHQTPRHGDNGQYHTLRRGSLGFRTALTDWARTRAWTRPR